MVLTVTLNPLLERKFYFKEIISNNSRAFSQKLLAGGKGINVSRQLNLLGVKNHALTFLGGFNGKKIRSILESEEISFSSVNTKSETREAALLFDEKNQCLKTYFGVNSKINKDEIELFISKLKKSIQNSSIVVFSGSLPDDECSIIIEKGIEFCREFDKMSVLDTYGKFLPKFIKMGPTVIHNNFREIEESFNLELNSEKKISAILEKLYKSNVTLAFLTRGSEAFYASKSDFHYRILNPEIIQKDPAGSGDAFVSGIVFGLEKSLVFNDFVKLASALGALNASAWDTCRVLRENAEKLAGSVEIIEIGKKIKIIDDSPTI